MFEGMKAIAIDGPASAGKSTMAKYLSKALRYIYVDTGALYRAIGLYCVQKGADTTDGKQVEELLNEVVVELKYVDGEQRVFLNGKDVSQEIRQPEISMAASNVSAISAVRDFLFELQRDMAKHNNVVMDGRDIGTVVLPEADLKIYLTASPEERARRRRNEYLEKGLETDYDALLQEIMQRDYNDKHRMIAPLKKAEDAIEVDTTNDNMEAAIGRLMELVKEKLGDVAV